MQSRSPMNHDPYEHFATREALAEVATRLDATLPHLATKADVERMGNRLLFWLTGTLVTCLLTFYGLHTNIMAAQETQIREVQRAQQELSERMARNSEQIARNQQAVEEQLARNQQLVAEQFSRLSEQIDRGTPVRTDPPRRPRP